MERPRPDPSTVLARRFDLANLRVQLRLAENLVAALDDFEREWDRFVGGMHGIIKACDEEGVSLWDPGFDEVLRKAEAIRLDLASRQQTVMPEFRDPLAKFLRTSVRTYSDALWTLIGVSARDSDGTLMLPLAGDGEPLYQVSPQHFEINADEARGEIARRRRILNEDVNKLTIMLEEAQRAPDALEGKGAEGPVHSPPTEKGNDVFIVHGHDEANLFRLRDLIEKRFKLHPVILKWEAGLGRAMIEKFEQEADRCGYAFVLLTSDDQIIAPGGEYTQARPNVVFELGWFYGRLDRSRVVILFKRGTKLHSDLEGISRIEFTDSVEEKLIEIERELVAAGMLSRQDT
jgi:predicted nucleotide-binding protein